MEWRTFTPKDPFKPSLQYSVRNIFLGRQKDSPGYSQLSQSPYPVLEKRALSRELDLPPTRIGTPITLRTPSPISDLPPTRIGTPITSRTRSRTTSRSSSPNSHPTHISDKEPNVHQTSIRSRSPVEDIRGGSRLVGSTSQRSLLLDDFISPPDGPPVEYPPDLTKSDVFEESQVQPVSLLFSDSVVEKVSPPLVSTKNDSPESLLSFKATSLPPLQSPAQRSSLSLSKSHVSEKSEVASDLRTKSPSEADFDIVSIPSGTDDNKPFGIEVYALAFVLDTLPRQIYLYFLLYLPSIYYSRVARIFTDAELSVYEIGQCILDEAVQKDSEYSISSVRRPAGRHRRRHVEVWSPYEDLERAWQSFIDLLLREWNTLNIISGLLLTSVRFFLHESIIDTQ